MNICHIKCLLYITLSLAAGCSSTKSTALHQLDDGSVVGISNGNNGLHQKTTPFKGIPITLKVPTHLDVEIIETYYLYNSPVPVVNAASQAPMPDPKAALTVFPELQLASLTPPPNVLREVKPTGQKRNLNVKATIVKTNKLFTVDMKRAAAGTTAYGASLNDQQYFDTITGNIQDDTVKEVSAAVQRLIPLIGKTQSAGGTNVIGSDLQQHVIRGERVVAYKRFDINEVDFEYQVEQFMNHHLNQCNNCSSTSGCPSPIPNPNPVPDVEPMKQDDEEATLLSPNGYRSALEF